MARFVICPFYLSLISFVRTALRLVSVQRSGKEECDVMFTETAKCDCTVTLEELVEMSLYHLLQFFVLHSTKYFYECCEISTIRCLKDCVLSYSV